MRLLLVADDPDSRRSMIRTVEHALPDATVVTAEGPVDLARHLGAGDIALVVAQANARWRSGFEILQEVRRHLPNCPVVMFDRKAGDRSAMVSLRPGLDGYVEAASEERSDPLGSAIRRALEQAGDTAKDAGDDPLGPAYQRLPVSVCRCTPEGGFVAANEHLREMLAIEQHADLNARPLTAYLDDPGNLDRILANAATGQGTEVLFRRSDGSECWTVMRARPAVSGPGGHLDCVFTDITHQKRAAARAEALLHEKHVLLEELYHRVNNNLQIVMSLVHQLVRETADATARADLQDLSARIQSLALVQDQLYRNQNFAEVDVRQYLEELSETRLRGCGAALALELVDLRLPIAQAIPLGLIANELLVNVVQHAFGGISEPQVVVALRRVDADRAALLVSDNGVGFALEAERRGRGYRLIGLLARQVGAEVSHRSESGSTIEVGFPVPA